MLNRMVLNDYELRISCEPGILQRDDSGIHSRLEISVLYTDILQMSIVATEPGTLILNSNPFKSLNQDYHVPYVQIILGFGNYPLSAK